MPCAGCFPQRVLRVAKARALGREIFLLGESGARDHPERLHDLSTMERALLPEAVAHFTVAGHSPQLSTETG